MRDDGTMARGTGYTTEFRAKAVRLPSGVKGVVFVGRTRY
jgi:hypothetical protein